MCWLGDSLYNPIERKCGTLMLKKAVAHIRIHIVLPHISTGWETALVGFKVRGARKCNATFADTNFAMQI
jgi:hypothetical protein